jgi:hypothetical protein
MISHTTMSAVRLPSLLPVLQAPPPCQLTTAPIRTRSIWRIPPSLLPVIRQIWPVLLKARALRPRPMWISMMFLSRLYVDCLGGHGQACETALRRAAYLLLEPKRWLFALECGVAGTVSRTGTWELIRYGRTIDISFLLV